MYDKLKHMNVVTIVKGQVFYAVLAVDCVNQANLSCPMFHSLLSCFDMFCSKRSHSPLRR